MDFLILRPLSPEIGYHFFAAGGGGVKSLCLEVCAQQGLNKGQIGQR